MICAAGRSGLPCWLVGLLVLTSGLITPPNVLVSLNGSVESLFILDVNDDPGREPGGVFCFAFARTPPEETHANFLHNLRASCDGHAVYSSHASAKDDVLRAFSASEEKLAYQTQMQEMTLGAWRQMEDKGIINRYDWFLKVEPDTFLVPSKLRGGVLRQNSSQKVVFGQRSTSDGFFVLMSQTKLVELKSGYEKHPECVEQRSFEIVSGANNDGHRPGKHGKAHCPFVKGEAALLDEKGDLLVAAWPDCHKLQRRARSNMMHMEMGASRANASNKRLCDRFPNGLLTCAEYGSSKDCSREDVALKRCVGGYGPHDDKICVSSNFVALHPVKLREDFEMLAQTFL